MKRFLCSAASVFFAAVVLLTGCSDKDTSTVADNESSQTAQTTVSSEPVVTLPPQPEEEERETPASYESFGVDKAQKAEFNQSVSEGCNVPIISVTTEGMQDIVSREDYLPCVVDVFNCDEQSVIDEASAGIRVRGNSTAFYGDVEQILENTVPYRIKFDSKTSMLGLNDGAECKSWVLLKTDWDLIKNDIAFRMGRAIMDGENYCSDSQFVHLYVNEEFMGIYLLCEQCQVNENRVDVTEPEEGYTATDIGYYLELDNYATSEEGNYYFSMDYCGATVTDINGETRQFVPAEYSIKNDVYSQNQIDFIGKYTNNLFTLLYEACENGNYLAFDENYELVQSQAEDAQQAVSAVIDIDSAVDMYILYEIVHDYDCGEGSFYMCVDFAPDSKYPKLTFTSPWDFDWAYNDEPDGGYYAAGFCEQSFVDEFGDRSNPWFILLMGQDWFVDMVREKWTDMNNQGTLMDCIIEESEILEAYEDDLNRIEDWATDSAYQRLEWIMSRIDWLDEQWLLS